MSTLTSPLTLVVVTGFAIAGSLRVFSGADKTLTGIGLVLVILLAVYLRAGGLVKMFRDEQMGFSALANTFLQHVIIFAALFIIYMDDYTIIDPTNAMIDSVLYSVDTTTTNGAAGITPSTTATKVTHLVNLLDSYLLLITLGFYVIKNVSSIAG
jgi:hypothetical protein